VSLARYLSTARSGWARVAAANLTVSRLPDARQFPQETWEWTVGRDLKDRIMGTYCTCCCCYC
jgi:hypothetical protein